MKVFIENTHLALTTATAATHTHPDRVSQPPGFELRSVQLSHTTNKFSPMASISDGQLPMYS